MMLLLFVIQFFIFTLQQGTAVDARIARGLVAISCCQRVRKNTLCESAYIQYKIGISGITG